METDSVLGDVEPVLGGLSLLDPLVDRILADMVSQQQGWLRVYGKRSARGPGLRPPTPAGFSGGVRYQPRARAEVMAATGLNPELLPGLRVYSSDRFSTHTGRRFLQVPSELVFVKQQQVVGSDSFKQKHVGTSRRGAEPVEQQGRSLSSTPESALITRRSGISLCFQVDVFIFYVSGSSSSS
ncbi:unnamed protein product [Pleuronectes platessa]|uniref:Uncharacterized protein n=1 Tax=Pleuronectes platessa TaxID=8262 RepID=A0A9N7Y8K7_PLEPL|nr:unnamed protein product [Pleuronectes platessa]